MIVPEFWAEARLQQKRTRGRGQVTVRRFGWSDLSPADAEQKAKDRAEAALAEILAGGKSARRERKLAYNGADGLPIREEIISRHGDVVVTRNAYGAACINTPNVVFSDVDFAEEAGARSVLLHAAALLGLALAAAIALRSVPTALAGGFLACVLAYPLALFTRKVGLAARGGAERAALNRIRAFAARHPDWHLRLYRTPAGLRVLVLHDVFASDDPRVGTFFQALGSDRVYVAMCRRQRCFRARVSPKPWRMGMDTRLGPRPGVWPIKAERLARRRAWVADYERRAEGFASCRFVEAMGSGQVHPTAEAVRDLHDRLARALDALPLA